MNKQCPNLNVAPQIQAGQTEQHETIPNFTNQQKWERSRQALDAGLEYVNGQPRDSSPTPGRRPSNRSTIDPLVKREAFAREIRKNNKDTKIKQKRAQYIESNKPLQITFLSSNCRGLNSTRKQQALADLINLYKVDVLTLQETKLTRRLWIKGFKTQQTQLARRGGCLCATSLNDTKPIKSLNQTISWMTLVHTSVPIHIFSVYIDPCDDSRAEKTIQDLRIIVNSLYRRTGLPRLIISGDFNQRGDQIDAITKVWGLQALIPPGTQTHDKGGSLDQVFTNLEVISCSQIPIDQKYSDHTPILSTLRFQRISKDYDMSCDFLIRKQWQLKEAAVSKQTIEHLLKAKNTLEENIRDLVERQVKPHKKVRRWYEGVKQRPPINIMEVEQEYKDHTPRSWKEIMVRLEQLHKEGSWKEFFALVQKLTKLKLDNPPIKGLKQGDHIIFDTDSIEEEIASYYEKLYSDQHHPLPQTCEFMKKDIFSVSDISKAIEQTNFNRGMGPDHFNGQVFKQSPELKYRVEREIADMLNQGSIPASLGEGRLIALSKKAGHDVVSIEDTRPITVRSHLSKIIEKAIKQKIELRHPHLLSTQIAQTGFKAGKGTQYNITKVLKMLHPGRGRKKKRMLLLVDLKKAFDSIDRKQMIEVLSKRCKTEEDRHIVALILKLHTNNKIHVGKRSFVANRGVAQGSVLAPLIFNVYLEEAIKQSPTLSRKYLNGGLLAFADDLIIEIQSQDEAVRVVKELELLNDPWKLQLNKEKSLIIGLEDQGVLEGIPCSNTAKYLGIKLHIDSKEQRMLVEDQINKNLKGIKSKLKHTNNDVKECLINSYARSLLHYFATPMRAANLWSREKVSILETRLYREAHGIPRDIRTSDIMNITSHSKPAAIIIERRANDLRLEVGRQTTLQGWKADKGSNNQGYQGPRRRLYLPKALSDTILALTRGRTTIYFGSGHFCQEHKQLVDDEHLKQCSLIQGLVDVRELTNLIRERNIHEWSDEERARVLLRVALLKGRLAQLTESKVYTPVMPPAKSSITMLIDKDGDTLMNHDGAEAKIPQLSTIAEPKRKGRPRKMEQIKNSCRSIKEFYKKKE